jgi:MFS transporter, MCT family, solute carrier family 16 (monocarboxylic acid transporters), member 10
MVPFTFLAAVVTYFWPFSKVEIELIFVAIVYGFSSGVYVAVLPAPVFAMGPVEETGGRLGTLMTILAPGALAGPPISGAIYARTGRFAEVGYFAGSSFGNIDLAPNLRIC